MRQFDYIVIGGGSGGIASARRAALHGAKVALIEAKRLGGTCVNVGCVPKKLMWNAAEIANTLHDAKSYGFDVERGRFDWAGTKARRDAAVARLVDIYAKNLQKDGVQHVIGRAKLAGHEASGVSSVEVNGERLMAPHVLLAVGGYPRIPELPGAQLGTTSNGFFELAEQPRTVAVVGAGYVGVELASTLGALGSKVSLLCRHAQPLVRFDSMLGQELMAHLQQQGVEFHERSEVQRVTRGDNGLLKITTLDQRELGGFDALLWAIGRAPATTGLGLDGANVETDARGFVQVDQQQNTSAPGVYAVGDVTGKVALTPVAIAAGRLLADRLFGGKRDAALDYHDVPSVVFSHPPIATVGLSEKQARESLGDDVEIYTRSFTNLYYAMTEHKPKTCMKLVTRASSGKVVGIHVIGRGADEMIQGFAVALRMGATKADLDRTVAVHPTAAEELVTLR